MLRDFDRLRVDAVLTEADSSKVILDKLKTQMMHSVDHVGKAHDLLEELIASEDLPLTEAKDKLGHGSNKRSEEAANFGGETDRVSHLRRYVDSHTIRDHVLGHHEVGAKDWSHNVSEMDIPSIHLQHEGLHDTREAAAIDAKPKQDPFRQTTMQHGEHAFKVDELAHPRYQVQQLRRAGMTALRKGDLKRADAAAKLAQGLNKKHGLGYPITESNTLVESVAAIELESSSEYFPLTEDHKCWGHDCGDGTTSTHLRQFADDHKSEAAKALITHLHGDHAMGSMPLNLTRHAEANHMENRVDHANAHGDQEHLDQHPHVTDYATRPGASLGIHLDFAHGTGLSDKTHEALTGGQPGYTEQDHVEAKGRWNEIHAKYHAPESASYTYRGDFKGEGGNRGGFGQSGQAGGRRQAPR